MGSHTVYRFDVRGSVHCKRIFRYNQQDAMLHNLFLCSSLRVSGGSSAHHQDLKNCIYSIAYFVKPLLLPFMTVAGSSKGLTNYQLLYIVLSSWWWAEEPPETCRVLHRNK